jgi:hypothetical protein
MNNTFHEHTNDFLFLNNRYVYFRKIIEKYEHYVQINLGDHLIMNYVLSKLFVN